MNFIEELGWRGMIHDIMPGTAEQLMKGQTTAYVGIDPTADSLHVGHLVSVMMMKLFQLAGHRPIFVIGGATGMIGDPSGKSLERNLLDEETIRHNMEGIKEQLARVIDFHSTAPNAAVMLNNHDWMKDFTFLDFIREIGKHITVNYMMSKDSVKKRLGADAAHGLSFTEFTYQLVQGYDFLYLRRHHDCLVQMGGSDQWGNITTGGELIRRKDGAEAYGLTWPLMTRSDGSKFGKTEAGNVWLDPRRTSPYAFYQFWLNSRDDDAERYIKTFTLLSPPEIETLVAEHRQAPHLRRLQQTLAGAVTCLIHGEEARDTAIAASRVLFGNATEETLRALDEPTLRALFDGVPRHVVGREELAAGIPVLELLAVKTTIFSSKGEARRAIDGNGVSVNKLKVASSDLVIDTRHLVAGKYILFQAGKKNYHLVTVPSREEDARDA
ncbi:MAG: tyrosine--tRNA ligase [Odoribacteraceae bacterium]|jgi:tyrosyl-tRNA synthetase|nr:tyrosine--tRNA ligase [Odoribacteraceae bacterium]